MFLLTVDYERSSPNNLMTADLRIMDCGHSARFVFKHIWRKLPTAVSQVCWLPLKQSLMHGARSRSGSLWRRMTRQRSEGTVDQILRKIRLRQRSKLGMKHTPTKTRAKASEVLFVLPLKAKRWW